MGSGAGTNHSVRQSYVLIARPPTSNPAPAPSRPAASRRAMPERRLPPSMSGSSFVVPPGPMLALGLAQRLWAVEAVVEVRVQVVGLVREYGAERAAVGREAPVPLVDVLAVGYRGGYGLVGVWRDACLHPCPVLPARGGTPVAERALPLLVLVVHEGKHRLFHVAVVGWAEGLYERLAVTFQSHRCGHG